MSHSDYNLTKSRTLQWLGIILILALFSGAYYYFNVRGATKFNASQTAIDNNGLVGMWSFDGAELTNNRVFAILEVAKTTRSDPFGHGGF